ncbi:MAG: histidinol-phosphate transaminase [bacterium]|nr:histidinol-phosphate transaminase [bacterium]
MLDIKKLARKEVFNFEPYVHGKPIDELKREFKIQDIYKLASNENSLGPSKKMAQKLTNVLLDVHRYPDPGCYDLRKLLVKKLAVLQENLLFGNGSDEIIELLGKAFLNKEDNIVTSAHSFIRYAMAADLMGAKVKNAKMTKDLVVDLTEMLKLIDENTKLVFIGNPNNPTGTYVKKQDFSEFMSKVPENVLVVMDEAYYEYAKDYPDYPDTLAMGYENLIVLRTFSKLFALAGLRIGYMIASFDIISVVERVRPPFNVNLIAQVAAVLSFGDKQHLQSTLEMNKDGMSYLSAEFDKMMVEYLPTITNFILFKTKIKGKDLFKKMLEQGVIIRSVDEYDLSDYARVTIGNNKENKIFIEVLKKVLT